MKAIKPKFNLSTFNSSNIKDYCRTAYSTIDRTSFFCNLRDTDTLITHDQANALYTENKIQKVIIDGEFITPIIQTTDTYKIYKDAVNKTAFLYQISCRRT